MPSSDSEGDGDDLAFLSPEESFDQQAHDQGASPTLRRSNRKRKSVSVPGNMSKTSTTKKKKNSPDNPGKSMPRIPRTPQGAAGTSEERTGGENAESANGLEGLLLAMENRLAARIDKASEAAREAVDIAKKTNAALEDLELKVEASEVLIREELKETEERVMKRVEDKVKDMVDNQLRAAGFDQDLSAGDLTIRSSARQGSYASVLQQQTESSVPCPPEAGATTSKRDVQEEKFWKARRSLRIWPVDSFDRKGVTDFLADKLKMDRDFITEELGLITVGKVRDPRSKGKVKNEAVVTFENKQVRDAVKAKAANLANYGQEVGMRLDLPDHLQKKFGLLMNLAYDLSLIHI